MSASLFARPEAPRAAASARAERLAACAQADAMPPMLEPHAFDALDPELRPLAIAVALGAGAVAAAGLILAGLAG